MRTDCSPSKLYFVLAILVFFFSGCTAGQSPTQGIPTPDIGINPSSEDTSLPSGIHTEQSATPTHTSTFVPELPQTTTPTISDIPTLIGTLPPTATPTADPLTHLRTQCPAEAASFPENARPTGFLVLPSISNLYLYDFINEAYTVYEESTSRAVVSPDHQHLYYVDFVGDQWNYVIATLQDPVMTVPYTEEWFLFRWIDDEHIQLKHGEGLSDTILILSPITGAEEELQLNLPNPFYTQGTDFTFLEAAVDGTMNRVVYFDTLGIGRVIMWDLQSNSMLAWLPHPVPYLPGNSVNSDYENGWSPDNNHFVVTSFVEGSIQMEYGYPAAEELFSISRDGEVRQLTFISERFDLTRFYEMRWSPNNRYIAFWLLMSENPDVDMRDLEARLIVLDTVTLEANDYCLGSHVPSQLAWSPNSEQLAVLSVGLQEGLYVLDITHNQIVRLSRSLTPNGWLAAP